MSYLTITFGTTSFLQSIVKPQAVTSFILMENEDHDALLLHESANLDPIFQSGKPYEVVYEQGSFPHRGFCKLFFIPVQDIDRPLIEQQLSQKKMAGEAIRFLRPIDDETYVYMTFSTNFQTEKDDKLVAYSPESYVRQYKIVSENDVIS